MNTELENMQFLGLLGVYGESWKIIAAAWNKIFNKITLTLILPLSFIFLFYSELSDIFFQNILHHSNDLTQTPPDTPQDQKLIHTISSQRTTLYLFRFLYIIFSLIATSAVVYTVASIYAGKEVTLNKVLSVVPKVFKRLMVTFLCTVVAFLVYNFMAALVLVFVIILLALTMGLSSEGVGVRIEGISIFVIIAILSFFYVAGFVYLLMIWQLASVVSVLEDSYGFEAMSKSKALIKGKMVLSVCNFLMLNLLSFVIEFLFMMMAVKGGKVFSLGYVERTACGILGFLMLSYLFLFMLVVQTVLYFVCKSYHHHIIDKHALLDHLEGYQTQSYESSKATYVQLVNHV